MGPLVEFFDKMYIQKQTIVCKLILWDINGIRDLLFILVWCAFLYFTVISYWPARVV